MTLSSRTLAALLVAGSLPLLSGSVAAAPIGQSHGLQNANPSSVEQVQWRGQRGGHWRGGRWIGPAAGGFAAGVAVGAMAGPRYGYDDGYYAYGAAPGYAAPRNRGMGVDRTSPQYGSCTGDRYNDSSFPSWRCR